MSKLIEAIEKASYHKPGSNTRGLDLDTAISIIRQHEAQGAENSVVELRLLQRGLRHDDGRGCMEIALRDAYAAGCNAAHQRSLLTALAYAEREVPRLREMLDKLAPQPASQVSAEVVEDVRVIMRTAEMSEGIMRNPERTGGWSGANKVANQFRRIAERAKSALDAMQEQQWAKGT